MTNLRGRLAKLEADSGAGRIIVAVGLDREGVDSELRGRGDRLTPADLVVMIAKPEPVMGWVRVG